MKQQSTLLDVDKRPEFSDFKFVPVVGWKGDSLDTWYQSDAAGLSALSSKHLKNKSRRFSAMPLYQKCTGNMTADENYEEVKRRHLEREQRKKAAGEKR